MKSLKVRCYFCGELVLDITCDKVVLEKVVNTRPRIVEKKEVYRCKECKDRHEGVIK